METNEKKTETNKPKTQTEDIKINKREVDMLHGSLLPKMILFAIPILFTSVLQQLFNAVDIAVLGHFAGNAAMAAVGSNGPLINLVINLLVGMAVGTNVAIANYIGQGRRDKVSAAIHTTIIIAVVGGVIFGAIGIGVAHPMLMAMDVPDNVMPLAMRYLVIFFCGTPLMVLYNFGASILRSKGDTLRPLICLLISGFIKVGLNLLFVVCMSMSVSGVALATIIANAISSFLVMRILMKEDGDFKLEIKKLRVSKEPFIRIVSVGLPSGIQGMVFSLSNVFIQSAINGFGSETIAGSSAALYFEYMGYFALNAFVQTTMTFIGQNYGAKNMKRCRKIYYRGLILGVLATGICNFGFYFARTQVVWFFTAESAVAEWAYIRMGHVLIAQWIATGYEISSAALRGMGHAILPAAITATGTCALRIAWIYTVFQWYGSFESLLNVYPISWIMTTVAVVVVYYVIRTKEEKRFISQNLGNMVYEMR